MSKNNERPASSHPPDQGERDSITHHLDHNVLVEAAAGTGKTTSLVARMVNLLGEGKCVIDHLAAVTFTRKAAAELRSRFVLELERAARAASGPRRDRLADAAGRVDACFLGTIHSFCARLLRERPIEAGIDASFTEIDDAVDANLRVQAWNEYVASLIAGNDSLLVDIDELSLDFMDLRKAFLTFADFPDVDEWPAPGVPRPEVTAIKIPLREYAIHMEEQWSTFLQGSEKDSLVKHYQEIPRHLRQVTEKRVADWMDVLETFKELTRVTQKHWGGKNRANAELERWNSFARNHALPLVRAWRAHRYGAVLQVLRPARAVYDRLRRQAGVLNYQDLLLVAARLLRDKPPIRTYFRKRFTHLLVDEFQDTDPIQAEVMLLLTAADPNEVNWRWCRPVPGALFVVGDPKQSIYRFRRADIATYNEVKSIIQASGGTVVSLSANFRATRPLIEWVNSVFTNCFPAVADDFSPAYVPLQVGRAGNVAGDCAGVYRCPVPGKTTEDIVEYEAAFIARTIRHALDAPRNAPGSGQEHDQVLDSRARPDDFLIVTRATKNLSVFSRHLQAMNIPHQVTGGTVLNEVSELRLLHACLRAVVHPDNPVALVAALRSELFGISDPALYAFKKAGGVFSFRARLPNHGLTQEEAGAFQDAFDRFKRYARWLAILPVPAAFEKVAADAGLFVRACAAPGGSVRAGSLAKALHLVRILGQDHLAANLVDYLQSLLDVEEKHDGLEIRPSEGGVVRVMNLHKVKGLEAPVVFLADPTGEFSHGVDWHIDRSGSVTRGYFAVYEAGEGRSGRLMACPDDWDKWKDRETQFQKAENHRLLYVAATRAGMQLVISQRQGYDNRNPWAFFNEYLTPCSALPDLVTALTVSPPTVHIDAHEVEQARQMIQHRWQTLRRKTYVFEAMKEISMATKAPRVDRGPVQQGEHGVEWGTLIHLLLETAMRHSGKPLEDLAQAATRDNELMPENGQAALDTVRAVMKSAIWQRAEQSPRRFVEVPLQMLMPTVEGVPTIRRGVIDLIFWEGTGWVVVDYKTDAVSAGHITKLIDYYSPQVRHYATSWSLLVKEPVTEIGLYFTRPDCYVPLNHPEGRK